MSCEGCALPKLVTHPLKPSHRCLGVLPWRELLCALAHHLRRHLHLGATTCCSLAHQTEGLCLCTTKPCTPAQIARRPLHLCVLARNSSRPCTKVLPLAQDMHAPLLKPTKFECLIFFFMMGGNAQHFICLACSQIYVEYHTSQIYLAGFLPQTVDANN